MSAHHTEETDGGVLRWPTPQVVDLPNKHANIKKWGGLNSLTSMAEETQWPTTTQGPSSPQGPETGEHGKPSSKVNRRLNPLFVTWLMGLPIGWLSLKPLEMESYQQWLQNFSEGLEV
jgi:hypothetical protein